MASPSIADIQAIVCARMNIPLVDLMSRRQDAEAVAARHVAMYLARALTMASLADIGKAFGDRHHTTVLHAVLRIRRMMKVNPGSERLIEMLTVAIGQVTAERREVVHA